MPPDTPPLPRCPLCGFEFPAELPRAGTVLCGRPMCGVELALADGQLVIRTYRLANHYSLCIFPFSFVDQEVGDVARRLRSAGRWQERVFSLDNAEDVERTEYFLPYIRRFLFPSLFQPPSERTVEQPTCQHWTFDLARLGNPGPDGLPVTLFCREQCRDPMDQYDLLIERIELLVFSYRVGFLVMQMRAPDRQTTFFDQMTALSYVRMIAPLYKDFEMPELVSAERRYRVPQLLAMLLEEFQHGTRLHPTAHANQLTPGLPVAPAYDDRMIVYSFSCIEKETAPLDAKRGQHLLQTHSVVNFDAESMTVSVSESADADPRAWLRARWQAFAKDGGSLVVFDTDRYHERFIGAYNLTYYFDIFILAVMQRVTLLTLFERLSDIKQLTAGDKRSLLRVRRDLLLFKNQSVFSQITNRERGLVLWRKWQKVFETQTILAEVNEQSEELDTYLRSKTRARVELLVRVGSFLAAAIPAVLSLPALLGGDEWVSTLRWYLLVALLIATGLFAYAMIYRQRDTL